jgi:HK97 gp10 family phage protein
MTENIKGMDQFVKKLDKLKGIKSATSLLAGLMVLQRHSQEKSPVKTGYMRSSPESHTVGDNKAETVWNASYTYVQEFGSEKMKGRFFISRALTEFADAILEAIGNQMAKELEGK